VVFLFAFMTAAVALDSLCNLIAAIVRRVNRPRYRWNRGGRFSFN